MSCWCPFFCPRVLDLEGQSDNSPLVRPGSGDVVGRYAHAMAVFSADVYLFGGYQGRVTDDVLVSGPSFIALPCLHRYVWEGHAWECLVHSSRYDPNCHRPADNASLRLQ